MGDTKLDARDEKLLDDLREGAYRGDVLPREEARDILAAYREEIVRETEGNDYSAQDIESERDALKAEIKGMRDGKGLLDGCVRESVSSEEEELMGLIGRHSAQVVCRMAERIEYLKAEAARLRDALGSVACLAGEGPDAYAVEGRTGLVQDIAKVALEALR